MKPLWLLMFLVLLSSDVGADSVRCGRLVVKTGESANALMKKCGSPVRKYSSKEAIKENGVLSRLSVSNWVYVRKGKKDRVVSVRSGTVVKIQVE